MNISRLTSVLVIIYLLLTSACWQNNNGNQERGDLISSSVINVYTIDEIRQLWLSLGIEYPIGLRYSVDAIRIVYQTVDVNENLTQASGALMVPGSVGSLPIISLQHGTESKRNLVATESPLNSVEGIAGLYMSSLGYLICIPDYLGFGISTLRHPYCHAQSNATASIDFIRAVRQYCQENGIDTNGQLFLTGYSEGGYVTLALQKEMEQNYQGEFNITAVAPMAGPYDLYGTIYDVFSEALYNDLGYIGYLFTAYNEIYGWNRLNDIFKSPYGDLMPDLFNGSLTWGQIVSQLPSNFTQLVKNSFRNDFLNGNEPEISSAFQQNTLLNWSPRAPLHFFHGNADQIVPYQNAQTTVSNLRNNGASSISLTTIYGGTHETAAGKCFIGMILWFDQFN
jgi:pimeloyl-ACP methyl ester carboxylesterase